MSGGGKSSLDDLMRVYSDLSGSGAGRGGFKGPAVKDIKREAPKQVFQVSNKASHWSIDIIAGF